MDSPYILKPTDHLGSKVAFHSHKHKWRLLKSGASDVGFFRLKSGTTYIERELEFSPLAPIQLKGSHLGDYLERELQNLSGKIDDEGRVKLRLGPNQLLGPVASHVAFAYKRFLKQKRSSN